MPQNCSRTHHRCRPAGMEPFLGPDSIRVIRLMLSPPRGRRSCASLVVSNTPERGRPVILLIHGRGMLDRDTGGTRKLWLDGLTEGTKSLSKEALIRDDDVRLVWYADVLDPRSTESCSYDADDLRAKRDRKTDPGLKGLVSLVGDLMGALTTVADNAETASTLRGFAGDAQFLADAGKRCASRRTTGRRARSSAARRPSGDSRCAQPRCGGGLRLPLVAPRIRRRRPRRERRVHPRRHRSGACSSAAIHRDVAISRRA